MSLGKVFGKHGFDVALIARSKERLDELTGKLVAEGIAAAGFPADVTHRAALTAAIDSAARRFGDIGVLHYSSPGAGTTETLRSTGPLEVSTPQVPPPAGGVYAGHVAIGTWIAGTPGAPEGAPLKEPDDIARLYWDLHTSREPAERLISA